MNNQTSTLALDTVKDRILKASQYLSIKDAREIAEFYKSIDKDSDDKAWKLEQLAQYAEDKARSYRRM